MVRTLIIFLILAMIAFVVIYNCYGPEDPLPPPPVIDTSTTGSAQTFTTTNKFDVVFSGLMCHVFDADSKRNRTVILKGPEEPKHYTTMYIPKEIDPDKLETATGLKPSKPVAGFVKISPLDGLTIRVVGVDASTGTVTPMQPALDKSGKNFDDYVPHLFPISNKTMTKVDPTIFDPVPTDVRWVAFFELEGGTFGATPYCRKSKFKKDHEKKGERFFAEDIRLNGEFAGDVQLVFTRLLANGTRLTTPVPFLSKPVKKYVRLEALPDPTIQPKSHFPHFQILGNATEWDDVEPTPATCPSKGPIPGCSNNQWP